MSGERRYVMIPLNGVDEATCGCCELHPSNHEQSCPIETLFSEYISGEEMREFRCNNVRLDQCKKAERLALDGSINIPVEGEDGEDEHDDE